MGSGQVGVGVSGGVFLCWLLVKGWAWGGSCVFSSVLPTTPFVKVLGRDLFFVDKPRKKGSRIALARFIISLLGC